MPFTYANLELTSSPVVSNGVVYIGSLDGNVYALNANTGALVWKTPAGGPIESSPAYSDGAVYVTAQQPSSGMLFKLDGNTGGVIWNLTLPYQHSFVGGTEMLGSPSIAAGMVFASSDWGAYYAVNETTGHSIWSHVDTEAIEFIVSSPIYVNGNLYIIDKFNITCLNAATGHTIWTAYTGDELYDSISYSNSYIYVVTSQRHVFVLDTAKNGATISTYTTPSSSWSSPTIANGRLYVGCNDWNVYCLENNATIIPASSPSNSISSGSILLAEFAVTAAILVVAIVAAGFVIMKRLKK